MNDDQLKQVLRMGYAMKDLRLARYTPKDLKDLGFPSTDYRMAGYSVMDVWHSFHNTEAIFESGYTAKELRETYIGEKMTAKEFREVGYTARDLVDVIYSLHYLSKWEEF